MHSYSLLENKLDRHEQRERALGDVIKRGLQTLQKGQKIFEPMRGTFARLDERISEIETELMAQDKKNVEQQEKLGKTLETILKWMVDNTGQSNVPRSADSSEEIDSSLSKKVEELTETIDGLKKQLVAMQTEHQQTEIAQKSLLGQIEKMVSLKQDSTDEVLSKMEEKLTHFYVTSPVSTQATPVRSTEWEETVSEILHEIKQNTLGQGKTEAPGGSQLIGELNKEFFTALTNETLEAIEEMRMEVLTASDKSFAKTATRIKEVSDNLETSLGEILKSVSESESSFESIIQSNKNLQKDILGLGKLEKIVLDTGDNVLAIKKGMEFNVHAVTLEVGEIIKNSGRDMNSTFHKRY